MNINQFVEKYYVDRRGSESLKWDHMDQNFSRSDLIPLWIADMDFKVADHISKTLHQLVDKGVYGYTSPSPAYYTAYKNWLAEHFNYTIRDEWVRFQKGAVQTIYDIIQATTQVGDSVAVLNPVYYPFHQAVNNTERHLVEVDLINNDGYFTIDYQAFEQAIVDQQVKLYIHCNPHNPVGRVWKEEELEQVFNILEAHDVLVISDEIHQDLVFENTHIPAAVLKDGKFADRVFTINSATKSFNLAGLTHSQIIIQNDSLRDTYDAYATVHHQSTNNMLGMAASQAAYEGGADWLKAVKEVIFHNYQYIRDEFAKDIPEIIVSPLEGTYLLFVDLRPVVSPDELKDFMEKEAGIAVDYGEWFGQSGRGFIRFNLATKPEIIETAVGAMKEALKKRQ